MEDRQRESALLKGYWRKAKAKDRRLTQEAIGLRLGYSQSRVAAWLNGHQRCPDYALEKLGDELGFDPDEIRPGYRASGSTADEQAARLLLSELIGQLSGEKREQVIDFIRFILLRR